MDLSASLSRSDIRKGRDQLTRGGVAGQAGIGNIEETM